MKTKILGRVQGRDGKSFCIAGSVNNISDLPPASSVEIGTHYYVGETSPREVYFSDGYSWLNQGYLFYDDGKSEGKIYYYKIDIDVNEKITDGNVDLFVTADDILVVPDAIMGSIEVQSNSSIHTVGTFKPYSYHKEEPGSEMTMFYNETDLFSENENNKFLVVACTGSCVKDLIQELFPEEDSTEIDFPSRIILVLVEKHGEFDKINNIDLLGIYCKAI